MPIPGYAAAQRSYDRQEPSCGQRSEGREYQAPEFAPAGAKVIVAPTKFVDISKIRRPIGR